MRGVYLGVVLFLLASAFGGCFEDEAPMLSEPKESVPEEDLVPRTFERDAPPVALRFRGDAVNGSVVNFTGAHPTVGQPTVYSVVEGTEIVRFSLEDMVPPDMPVKVTVLYVEHGWMGVRAELVVDEGRLVRGETVGGLVSLAEDSWYVWREGGAPVTLVLQQSSRGGCICYPPQDWQIQVTVVSDPGRLQAHVPTLVALDPAVPVRVEDVAGEAADLVVFDPVVGVVYRGPAAGTHTLPQELEPGIYVVALTVDAYIPEASAVVMAGFSGHGIPLGVEAIARPPATTLGLGPATWTESTERAPWGVGFVDERTVGAGPGDGAWSIEWGGTTIFDSSPNSGEYFARVDCVTCKNRFGTDLLATTFGPGAFTFKVDDPHTQGEVTAYFGYLVLDGLFPAAGGQ